MSESILPALDPKDSLAQEQAGLLMGHINALLQQAGQEPNVNAEERQAMVDLAQFLLSVADGGSETERSKERLAAALENGSDVEISLATERLIAAADATRAFKDAAWAPILKYSKEAAARGQQWFKPMGF
jgi:hypothetical protein